MSTLGSKMEKKVCWRCGDVDVCMLWRQEGSWQEAAAHYLQLSHSAARLPWNDNGEPSHRSSWQHGFFFSSQSPRPISSIFSQVWNFQQFHFLATASNIVLNLPRLITNMKLSAAAAAAGRTGDVIERRAAPAAIFATSCWHPAKAGGSECNTLCPPEGPAALFVGEGGRRRRRRVVREPLRFIT